MDEKQIGRFIRELRMEKKITQQELAGKIGVKDSTISNWENGKVAPNTELLIPLSEELGITVLDLIKGKKVIDKDDAIIDLIKHEDAKIKMWKYSSIVALSIILIITTIITCLLI